MPEQGPDWKALEILIAKIQQELAPDARVEHNVKIFGHISQTDRQIDVLVKQRIGQYVMTIIIDCKDYATPVDVNGVGAFYSVIQDVKANKGAMVSPKGFTEAAKTFAKDKEIELYSPVDTDPHKWQVKINVPAVCKFRETQFAFGISMSAPAPFMLPNKFIEESVVLDKQRQPIGSPLEVFRKQWNEDHYPSESGSYEDLPLISGEELFMDNGYDMGLIVPVELTISLTITEKRYFGHVPITQISGLKDEQTGLILARKFITQFAAPDKILETWQEVQNGEQLPVEPLFTLTVKESFTLE